MVAYRTAAEVPAPRELAITVDAEKEALLLPLYGVMVPFHISTVKALSSTNDADHAVVRVTFHVSGAYEPAAKHPAAIFLKELSFRCAPAAAGVWAPGFGAGVWRRGLAPGFGAEAGEGFHRCRCCEASAAAAARALPPCSTAPVPALAP